jgi:adenylate cyclase
MQIALTYRDIPSIAVLPFENLTGDPDQGYFADGIVEEIITALSRFRSLFVIARNSSFATKNRLDNVRRKERHPQHAAQIGRIDLLHSSKILDGRELTAF